MVKQFLQFLQEVKAELKKVTWPKRKEVIDSTTVVIITTIIVIIYLAGVDRLFSKLMHLFLR